HRFSPALGDSRTLSAQYRVWPGERVLQLGNRLPGHLLSPGRLVSGMNEAGHPLTDPFRAYGRVANCQEVSDELTGLGLQLAVILSFQVGSMGKFTATGFNYFG